MSIGGLALLDKEQFQREAHDTPPRDAMLRSDCVKASQFGACDHDFYGEDARRINLRRRATTGMLQDAASPFLRHVGRTGEAASVLGYGLTRAATRVSVSRSEPWSYFPKSTRLGAPFGSLLSPTPFSGFERVASGLVQCAAKSTRYLASTEFRRHGQNGRLGRGCQ